MIPHRNLDLCRGMAFGTKNGICKIITFLILKISLNDNWLFKANKLQHIVGFLPYVAVKYMIIAQRLGERKWKDTVVSFLYWA